MAISGVAATDGQVQIEMGMMCQTGAVARDNEGLVSTNPHWGCPGITASMHRTWRNDELLPCNSRAIPNHARAETMCGPLHGGFQQHRGRRMDLRHYLMAVRNWM